MLVLVFLRHSNRYCVLPPLDAQLSFVETDVCELIGISSDLCCDFPWLPLLGPCGTKAASDEREH